MSLRYRLFLTISGVFVVVAICSAFLENYVTHRELAKAQKEVRDKILDMSEKGRISYQNYFAQAIAENEVNVDAILTNIASFSDQIMRFAPTANNLKKGTWGDAADLLLEYKWVDFLQNTNEGKITAAILPQASSMEPTYRIDIDKDLCWVYLKGNPYIGVRVLYSPEKHSVHAMGDGEIVQQSRSGIPSWFLLFDPAEMASVAEKAPIFQETGRLWPPIPVHWAEGYVLEVDPFVAAFRRARMLLLNGSIKPPEYSPEKMDGTGTVEGGLFSIPSEPLIESDSSEKMMKDRLEQISLRFIQADMIWGMIAFFDTGLFGDQLFSYPAPAASAVFSLDNSAGLGMQTQDVMFPTPQFDDCAYFTQNPPQSLKSEIASSIAVIPSSDRVFLGNTARFVVKTPEEERTGFITLATDADLLLQRFVTAVHQAAFLYMGTPLSGYDMNGQKIQNIKQIPFSQMAVNKSGIVSWNGENYFFLNLKPFPNLDLHVFLLNPEAKQFALLHDLESGGQKVVSSILWNIHIAGLVGLGLAIILLHGISRRITKPIIQLAHATEDVVEGRLDQIKLTLPPLKHEDEIAVLCHSFEEMVKGLQEKEKVKGVLNKVVSREIAQEILKGAIHLGGEEKVVTVLFADIREFTQLTQNMKPQEVIELLNACMTKISQVIDKNGGVIDKYVGDEAMALFGAPISSDKAALKAIQSAIEMIAALREWNKERASKGQPPIEMGIGIHTGAMLVGNMGAENRLNYTVIGSNVNLAARLCSAAKRMEILISKETLDEPFVKDAVQYEEISLNKLKGFDQPITVYRIQGLK